MTFGSLFSGIGGFDKGLEDAGMSCKWQVENNEFCTRILERHWPCVARFDDVREFTPNRDEHSVDLICGGFPCTDVSVAGRRAGLAGEATGLFWHIIRVASILATEWIVCENVPGLLSSRKGEDFALVLGGFTGMVPRVPENGWGTAGIMVGLPERWSVAYRTLDARYFGVAQRRRRVFLVCHPSAECAASILFEPESGERNPATVREAGQDVTRRPDAGIDDSSELVATLNSGGSNGGFRTEPGEHLISATLRSRSHRAGVNYPGRGGEDDTNLVSHAITNGRQQRYDPDASEDGTGRGTPIVSVPTNQSTEQQRSHDGSGHAYCLSGTHRGQGNAWNTSLVPTSGTEINSRGVRDCTGFSAGMDDPLLPKGLDSARYRAIGNAVVPAIAQWLGDRIMKVGR